MTKVHFFSRYSYIWKFDQEKESAYTSFLRASNLTSLRLVTFITLFGMSLFLIIDFFKDVDFSIVLGTRIVVLSGALAIMWLTYRNISNTAIALCVGAIVFLNYSAALITATFAGMPSYYLTNLLFLIFILVITASGLHFRYALIINLMLLGSFFYYSQFINPNPFYFTQYAHLLSIFLYMHIVGVVLENRRRNNYLQFKELSRQKRIVDDLNQQKNKVISILSHDLAAPMNALSAILHLQNRGAINEEELRIYLGKLGEEFNNVSFLLHSIVRWSKSQMEGFVLSKKDIDLIKLIEVKKRLFQSQLAGKGLELKLKPSENCTVHADEEMVRIALRNILSNAVKFSNSGTIIDMEVLENGDGKVQITITNHGDPIPEHVREKIFSYHITSNVDTRGERGTGLGLAITAFFLRLNGGDIKLIPSSNGTTTFCIELPKGPAPDGAQIV